MLDDGEMPPADSEQPSNEQKEQLRNWVQRYIDAETRARAGDPGLVPLRRLSNAEYTYTLRDLTGVSLDPADEFPVDGAAGEGFTNTGSGQGMSPALVTKYLDAAKDVASHVVLLPDGIRFSTFTTRRDQTDELVRRIQDFYRRFTEKGTRELVELPGFQYEMNPEGLLPVEKYLAATLEERDAIATGRKTTDDVARERGLNPRYLARLWSVVSSKETDSTSPLVDELRELWRQAKPDDAAVLAAEIAQVQASLWKFNSVGQIGRTGGPGSWLEAVSTATARHEVRLPLPEAAAGETIELELELTDLGDGNEQDFVVWQQPRFEFKPDASGRVHPPLLLRDLRDTERRIRVAQTAELPRTTDYLKALASLHADRPTGDIEALAQEADLDAHLLQSWTELVGFSGGTQRTIQGHLANKLVAVEGYQAINGWGSAGTPSMLSNRSNEDVQFLTLTVPARGVTVHPSPNQESMVVWRSPLDGSVVVEGLVADMDGQCGNGAAWRIELQSAQGRSVLAEGILENGQSQQIEAGPAVDVRAGDLVSLYINARDNNHACDTTQVGLRLTESDGETRAWDLAADVVDTIQDGNPLPDAYGHAETWHFCAVESAADKTPLAADSSLGRWQAAVLNSEPSETLEQLASSLQAVLVADDPQALSEADRVLRTELLDWKGPLRWSETAHETPDAGDETLGLDRALFGSHPDGSAIDPGSLCQQAPHRLSIRLPATLIAGSEFVVSGELHEQSGAEGSAQLRVHLKGADRPRLSAARPLLVREDSAARRRVEAGLDALRELFPPALCYTRIIPVDEVVTLTLFHREDDHLRRLMLNDAQAAELDRLWDELIYVSQEPLQSVVVLEQIYEFATQDRPDLVNAFAPMREPVAERANAFRQQMLASEPAHVDGVLRLAARAWRRPLSDGELQSLNVLYQELRAGEMAHEQALELMLARVLSSPAFMYKLEQAPPGSEAGPVSSLELASRLSYFLWSSLPDDELRQVAESGALTDEETLIAQTRRMLAEPRTRRLAIEFACQWLHLRDFDQNDDKNEQLYPEFAGLRGAMYEETVRFFSEMFRGDCSILDLLEADHTFVNAALAEHYGIGQVSGDEWQRVDGLRAQGRGGVLGMATFLASQSGASRTSPILRGNWVYETLLGERLPRPPANVPILPDDVPEGLTERQLIEQHSSVAECAKCHRHIDPFGFALEQYDAIGRMRPATVDTATTLADGTQIAGLDGLRAYLSVDRRDAVVRQFCRKLLGFALGREVLLSDEPLLAEMQNRLRANDYRFSSAVETIVASPQFQTIRGREANL